MPPQCRVGDFAHCGADAHGKPCCSHSVEGPGILGSFNINVNGRMAMRLADPGVHGSCCGPNTWVTAMGSTTVFFNNRPAVRFGDTTTHCGGTGSMIQGSLNVLVGG